MNNLSWVRIREIVERHRIVYGVIGALLIATLLTAISMALYVSSGASRLDLSRPGYEGIREEVGDGTIEEEFSATGPINVRVANDFQGRLDEHRKTMKRLGAYDSKALDDNELQIAPSSGN